MITPGIILSIIPNAPEDSLMPKYIHDTYFFYSSTYHVNDKAKKEESNKSYGKFLTCIISSFT
jgi:hypothetical protein